MTKYHAPLRYQTSFPGHVHPWGDVADRFPDWLGILAQLPARHNFSVTGDEFSRIRLSGRGWSAGRRAAMAGFTQRRRRLCSQLWTGRISAAVRRPRARRGWVRGASRRPRRASSTWAICAPRSWPGLWHGVPGCVSSSAWRTSTIDAGRSSPRDSWRPSALSASTGTARSSTSPSAWGSTKPPSRS